MEKAFNAEKAVAKAILVMDDREEQLLTMAAPEDHPEIAKLREDITIPTALIRRVSNALALGSCSIQPTLLCYDTEFVIGCYQEPIFFHASKLGAYAAAIGSGPEECYGSLRCAYYC